MHTHTFIGKHAYGSAERHGHMSSAYHRIQSITRTDIAKGTEMLVPQYILCNQPINYDVFYIDAMWGCHLWAADWPENQRNDRADLKGRIITGCRDLLVILHTAIITQREHVQWTAEEGLLGEVAYHCQESDRYNWPNGRRRRTTAACTLPSHHSHRWGHGPSAIDVWRNEVLPVWNRSAKEASTTDRRRP